MNRKIIGLLTMCMAVCVLSGCSRQETSSQSAAAPVQQETQVQEEQVQETQGVTIEYPQNMQEKGYTQPLQLEQMPQRVVVMTKAPVLALHELGVKMIAIPEGGVTSWPEELDAATEKLNTAMNSNFDIETVIALEPDLVVMGYTSQEAYGQALDDAGIPVYYVDAGHTVPYESVKAQTQVLADAFAADQQAADSLMQGFVKLEERLSTKLLADLVAFQMSNDRLSCKKVLALAPVEQFEVILVKLGIEEHIDTTFFRSNKAESGSCLYFFTIVCRDMYRQDW